MEELRSSSATACAWLDENEDELVRELLDDESPFFFLAKEAITSSESKLMSGSPANHDEQTINQLISKVYSGPTIQDIENALSMTTTSQNDPSQQISQARISLLQRGLSKIENNKYTLKLKSCGNGMADDGYKWRKYGQKSIKNSPFPRSYYRCTNPRCSAKKQVERSVEDQDTLVITYEGLHLHFAYPYFFFNQSQQQDHVVDPPSKKKKRAILHDKSQANETQQRQQDEAQECSTNVTTSSPAAGSLPCTIDDYVQEPDLCPQGLLEDVVVPYMIRNPSNYNVSSNSSSSSSYSYPTSPSSFSWSPNQYNLSCVDIGTNTSIR